jgi:predicted phosphodiesterase
MRLQILSDLHLEFGTISIPETVADVVVLAGDIHVGREGLRWALKQFPKTPVIYVLGNHEFYRHSLPDLTETLKQESDGSHIHVLENNAVEISGYTFLGCTLWTDFLLLGQQEAGMLTAEDIMSDYKVIDFGPQNRVLRARDTARLHAQSAAWLRSELAERKNRANTIIVTHHAPSIRSEAPYHLQSMLSSAFASNLDSLVDQSGVPLWIHGHTHYNVDYRIGSTRVLTNQHGYPQELSKGFDAGLIFEV